MLQVIKGTAHSLAQSDFIGTAVANEGVKQGMLVLKNASGAIKLAGAAASGTATDAVNTARYGFAVNAQVQDDGSAVADGDVVESGKIGAYGLDGNSVIGTNQAAATINTTNYPIGTFVIPDATATGKVRTQVGVATGRVVGVVNGIRSLRNPSTKAVEALLEIKLAS